METKQQNGSDATSGMYHSEKTEQAKISIVLQKCIPGRYKEIHWINGSALLTLLWSMAKHVLPKKMKERMIFHSKPEDLLNFFPPDMLPTQWGGTLTDYHDENIMQKFNKEHGRYPMGGPPNYF
ncbi:hypothetical protein AVEN_109958-1 [Araneus ventricosus]|uniref:CRAL-TRIO domain-containing protein n=1 Tax=Araneus ventricosus TaxID=182803 RepID=A0A4Y2TYZ2_ARAVE|nr:hypothetical protein AVEN_109958-1 [Araneus ventricosus]